MEGLEPPDRFPGQHIGACLKIHFRHLHASLRGIFKPDSVSVAHYASLIRPKSPTKCDAHLTKNNFQIRSSSVPACQFAHMSINRWSRTRTCGVSDVTVLQTAALAAGHIHLYDPQRLYPLQICFILFFLQPGHLS